MGWGLTYGQKLMTSGATFKNTTQLFVLLVVKNNSSSAGRRDFCDRSFFFRYSLVIRDRV